MNLASPISSVIPSAYGPVLEVLARAGRPLSGRAVASLTNGRVGQRQTNTVLNELAEAGIVHKDTHSVGNLYTLNRDHVAAPAIEILAGLRDRLIERMTHLIEGWQIAPVAMWIFGSVARGEGNANSDLDVLVVRRDRVAIDEPVWTTQLDDFARQVTLWGGNSVEILELSESELAASVAAGEPLIDSLRSDALAIAGLPPTAVLRRRR